MHITELHIYLPKINFFRSYLANFFALSKGDDSCDTDFTPDMDQYIVWAVGGLDQTAFIHSSRADRKYFFKTGENLGSKGISVAYTVSMCTIYQFYIQ